MEVLLSSFQLNGHTYLTILSSDLTSKLIGQTVANAS